MAPPNPFPGFRPFSSGGNTYLYTPTPIPGSQTQLAASPDLIILSTWMGALPKHILKYVSAYQASYPSASILLLTSSLNDFFITPIFVQRHRVASAVEFIQSFKKS